MVRGHRKNGDCSDVIITAKEEQGERACFRAVSGPAVMPKLGSVMRVKADVGGPLQIREFIAWCGDSTARPQSVRSQVCRAKATGPSLPGQDCLRARTGARAVIEEHPSRSWPSRSWRACVRTLSAAHDGLPALHRLLLLSERVTVNVVWTHCHRTGMHLVILKTRSYFPMRQTAPTISLSQPFPAMRTV